jgi:hypothetical protein
MNKHLALSHKFLIGQTIIKIMFALAQHFLKVDRQPRSAILWLNSAQTNIFPTLSNCASENPSISEAAVPVIIYTVLLEGKEAVFVPRPFVIERLPRPEVRDPSTGCSGGR